MPSYVTVIVVFGVILAFIGFTMAFRQPFVRRLIGRPQRPSSRTERTGMEDPLTYILRIAGIMIMVFGTAIAMMLTLFHLA